MFKDTEAEYYVLSHLIQNKETFGDYHLKISPDHFTDERLKTIYNEVKEFFLDSMDVLDWKTLEDRLTKNRTPEEIKTNCLLTYQGLLTFKPSDGQFVHNFEIVTELCRKRNILKVTDIVRKSLLSGAPSIELQKKLQSYEASVSGDIKIKEFSAVDKLEERQKEYLIDEANPNTFKGIPTGFKALDDLIGGSLPGELSFIFSRTGGGKSRTLFSVAYNGCVRGYNFMYVTIEMPAKQVMRLFDSRSFLISSTGLRKGKLEAEDRAKYFNAQEIAKVKANLKGDFHIVDIPEGCSVPILNPIIQRYKKKKPLHGLIIDYANLMSPSTGRTGDLTKDLLIISRELKELARREDLDLWSAVQANKSVVNLKLEEIGTEHVSYSDALTWSADLLVYLRKEAVASTLQRVLDMKVIKWRDGADVALQLGIDWDRSYVGDMEELLQKLGAIVQ